MDLVGADVLGDPTRLAGDDLGLPDRVEQRRLAVVDVAHDRDHRRAVDELVVGVIEDGRLGDLLGGADHLDLAVERVGEHLDGLVGERLRERRHLAEAHELLDHVGAADAEDLGDLAHGRARGHLQRRLLDLDMRPERRLFEQRPATAATAAARRAAWRRVRHLIAASGLRVDDHAATLLLSGAAAIAGGSRLGWRGRLLGRRLCLGSRAGPARRARDRVRQLADGLGLRGRAQRVRPAWRARSAAVGGIKRLQRNVLLDA